jgi:hypothetical protein
VAENSTSDDSTSTLAVGISGGIVGLAALGFYARRRLRNSRAADASADAVDAVDADEQVISHDFARSDDMPELEMEPKDDVVWGEPNEV